MFSAMKHGFGAVKAYLSRNDSYAFAKLGMKNEE
jgi:hypothetical protein